MSKLGKWAAIAFLAWFAITLPVKAGHEVGNLGHLGTHAASSVATMIDSI